MIDLKFIQALSEKLHEEPQLLRERIKAQQAYKTTELPKLKKGLSIRLDKDNITTTINNLSYPSTTQQVITTPEGIDAVLFSEATRAQQAIIAKHRMNNQQQDKFSFLKQSGLSEGILIIIPKGYCAKEPITIHSTYDTNGFFHLLIIAHDGSQAMINRIITEQRADESKKGLIAETVEMVCEAHAHITYSETQHVHKQTCWQSSKRCLIGREGVGQWYSHVQGGSMCISELHATLAGEKAYANALNTSNLTNRQEAMHQCTITQNAAGTKANMAAKSVVTKNARLLACGLITMGDEACDAEGFQQHDALIDEEGVVDIIPELSILNEQVTCSHGATIGNLDKEASYYLASRGIPKQKVKQLLVASHLRSITKATTDQQWTKEIERLLEDAYARITD